MLSISDGIFYNKSLIFDFEWAPLPNLWNPIGKFPFALQHSPCPRERRQGRTDSNLPPQDATSPLPPDPLLLFPSECPPAWQTVCREHLNWCKNRAKHGPVKINFGSFFCNQNAFFPHTTNYWLWNLACIILLNVIDIFWKLYYQFDKIWNSARNISQVLMGCHWFSSFPASRIQAFPYLTFDLYFTFFWYMTF